MYTNRGLWRRRINKTIKLSDDLGLPLEECAPHLIALRVYCAC
jgi:hypothetical protein